MARIRQAQRNARSLLDHETAQTYLFDYYYGRLPRDLETTVEAHVRSCAICRSDGLRHLATERMQAMQQRPKSHPRSSRPIIVMLSLVLILVVSGGFFIYHGAHAGILRELLTHNTAGTAIPTSTTMPTVTPTPAALGSGTPLGSKGIVALAASPDGKSIALATNPASLGGTDPGGVTIASGTAPVERLAGFEHFRAPGSLVWSPDGHMLAASGLGSLFVWQVRTGQLVATLALPASPGTNLSVFDVAAGAIIGSVPATIFAASGFAEWGSSGKLSVAPAGAGGATNIPDPSSSVIALWGGQQGARIFSINGTTMIGMDDTDVQLHAAFLRWSPDGHYLVWGYPRLAIDSTLLNTLNTPSPENPNGVDAPDAAVAALVNAVGQGGADASATIWYNAGGTEAIVDDATQPAPTLTVRDPDTDAIAASFDLAIPAHMLLGGIAWLNASPAVVVVATGGGTAREIALNGL